jgi:hypothetical protein
MYTKNHTANVRPVSVSEAAISRQLSHKRALCDIGVPKGTEPSYLSKWESAARRLHPVTETTNTMNDD